MTDYIRKAVELADGFTYYGDTDQFFGPMGSGLRWFSAVYLDALAAQLVRQHYKKRPQHYPLTHESDPMVTIKDIVDSKVLE